MSTNITPSDVTVVTLDQQELMNEMVKRRGTPLNFIMTDLLKAKGIKFDAQGNALGKFGFDMNEQTQVCTYTQVLPQNS